MDKIKIRTEKTKYVAHGTTEIEVIYTNDIRQVEETLDLLKCMQRGVPADEQFMGLDFEFTHEKREEKKKVTVVQLCVNRTVLVYQLARPNERCEALISLFCGCLCKFVGVDIRADRRVMNTTWGFEIPHKFHVDIQDSYHIKGSVGRSGMAALAGEIIDGSYRQMKSNLPPKGHDFWEKQPLDEVHLRYAAIDGFVAFELYRLLQSRHKGPVVLQPPPKLRLVFPNVSAPSTSYTSGSKRSKWEEDIYEDGRNKGDRWNDDRGRKKSRARCERHEALHI